MNEHVSANRREGTANGHPAAFVINGVEYPADPRKMTPEEIREFLFLPRGTGIDVVDTDDVDEEPVIQISWPEGIGGEAVLHHIRRIIRERMARMGK
ncbi:MAG: hypothetical protein ACRDNL_22795 [Spirillospora sp.]